MGFISAGLVLREDAHKKTFFFSGGATKRGDGGKTPLTTKQKTRFLLWLKIIPEPHETQDK